MMDNDQQWIEPKALLVVDYTIDFIASDGKLTVGEPGQKIESAIAEKIRSHSDQNHLIIIANDLHDALDENHPEHKLFPPHNLAGTDGRRLYGEIESLVEEVAKDKPGLVVRLDKRRYSAFCGTPVEQILRQENINEIEIVGVCTDICILHTAIDAYNKGFFVFIDEAAVDSFNREAHDVALNHFESVLGFQVKRRG
jgi:nicotinamidase-related amidase